MSNESKNIYAKLMAARQEFHAIKLVKSGHNEFSNYRYFQLEDFMPFALKCLDAQGLIPVVSFSADLATMTIYEIKGEGTIVITSPLSSAKLKACHEVQNVGACESYSRRYLWLALFEVVEGDPIEGSKVAIEPATPEQLANLWEYAETDFMNDGQRVWLEKANDKITFDQAEYALKKLREAEESA